MKKLDLTNCELHEILALNLVSVRLNAELEQSDIAEMFNVSVQTISSYECGTSIPSPAFVYRYASYFSIPVERLFRAEPQAGEAAGSDVPLIPDREEARMLACYRATPASTVLHFLKSRLFIHRMPGKRVTSMNTRIRQQTKRKRNKKSGNREENIKGVSSLFSTV